GSRLSCSRFEARVPATGGAVTPRPGSDPWPQRWSHVETPWRGSGPFLPARQRNGKVRTLGELQIAEGIVRFAKGLSEPSGQRRAHQKLYIPWKVCGLASSNSAQRSSAPGQASPGNVSRKWADTPARGG